MEARQRRRYDRIGQNPNDVIVSNKGAGRTRSTGVLIFAMVVLALSTTVFMLVLLKRLNDEDARNLIRQEEPLLEQAITNLNSALIDEQNLMLEKNISLTLLPMYEDLKVWINVSTMQIESIDDLTILATQVNSTIQTLYDGYSAQITDLENALKYLQSVAFNTTGVVVKSGTCTFQGTTSVSINYAYKRLVIGGLDYYYYVFDPSAQITIDNTGASINSCSPNLYLGPLGETSPIFSKQTESFVGDGAAEIVALQAGNNALAIKTSSFAGTKSLSVAKLTHLVSFF